MIHSCLIPTEPVQKNGYSKQAGCPGGRKDIIRKNKGYNMKIRVLKTIEGAKEAEGLTVMIDVFRAFSLECYLFAAGARRIYPVKDLE